MRASLTLGDYRARDVHRLGVDDPDDCLGLHSCAWSVRDASTDDVKACIGCFHDKENRLMWWALVADGVSRREWAQMLRMVPGLLCKFRGPHYASALTPKAARALEHFGFVPLFGNVFVLPPLDGDGAAR